MRIFVVYHGDRVTVDVGEYDTVEEVKALVRDTFSIGADQGPSGLEGSEGQEHKVLTLHHQGADLDSNWVLADVGIASGSTVKAMMKNEITPILYIKATFNKEIYPILDQLSVQQLSVIIHSSYHSINHIVFISHPNVVNFVI